MRFFGLEITSTRPVAPPAPAPAPAPQPPITCLACPSDDVVRVATVLNLRYAVHNGFVVEYVAGGRYSCQACGCIFVASKAGIYEAHRDALPITLTRPAQPPAKPQDTHAGATPAPTMPRRRPPPLPIERPAP